MSQKLPPSGPISEASRPTGGGATAATDATRVTAGRRRFLATSALAAA